VKGRRERWEGGSEGGSGKEGVKREERGGGRDRKEEEREVVGRRE
jgi:hypothetical protein